MFLNPIIITRPHADACFTQEVLHARGETTIIAPLLEIVPIPVEEDVLRQQSWQALIVTSANAVRVLAEYPYLYHIPLIAVGTKTGNMAKKAGFQTVHNAGGTGQQLLTWMSVQNWSKYVPFLYVAGEKTAVPIKAVLEKQGFLVTKIVVYRTYPVPCLPLPLRDMLEHRREANILFYSRNTARVFVQCIAREGLQKQVTNMCAYTLSQQVADAILYLPWRHVTIASAPTEVALLHEVWSNREGGV